MALKKNIEKYISVAILVFAIGFNLWIYRLEPTALVDPNDNTFQYALVERTNQIWESGRILSLSNHWVPNWAQGYNLPVYYSHIPQILIVGSWRLMGQFISLFTYYHWVIYLLLVIFPLCLFLALRVVKMPWLAAGIGALIASQLSTDGLYGLDPPSFLWRGYGLSSQLFAMLFLPLAMAFVARKNVKWSILFLAATTAGHLGMGMIAILAAVIITIGPTVQAILQQEYSKVIKLFTQDVGRLLLIIGGVVVILGYWIIPAVVQNNYHNISFWDPIWKFDSYGTKIVLTRLFNGDLFDFGRSPILTLLVLVGLFVSLQTTQYISFALLFIGMLILYFGRATWGPLIDLIPGMREFHLSRFIVGVQLAGLFLIPIGVEKMVSSVMYQVSRVLKKSFIIDHLSFIIFTIILVALVYPQTLRYAALNDKLILQANQNFEAVKPDLELLLSTLKAHIAQSPGRVFAGRGGGWGKGFRVAETPYYMYLSTYGIPTVLWLPQTWSPSSDIEQYFSEENLTHYELFNIRYVVAPPSQAAQPFWKLLEETKTWKLYEIATSGYVIGAVRPAIVASTKEDYKNVVRMWMHSVYPTNGLYPQLTLDTRSYPQNTGLPNFKMVDEVTYQVPDGSLHSIFAEPPVYLSQTTVRPTVVSQSDDTDMVFKATVEVPEGCTGCIVVLRQTYHPNWKANIDGKPVKPFGVFPFYTAVTVETSGTHEIIFSYR
jgi:hypothetical protein